MISRHRSWPLCFVAATLLILAGCAPAEEAECRTSQDCDGTLFCRMGVCTDLNAPAPLGGSQPWVDDAGGLADADDKEGQPHPCPDAPGADASTLVLNELLATVPQGPAGDANGDGVRHFHDDEFVELVNISEETIDMTGVQIFNDETLRFTFPEFCLLPLHAAVVFGGIEPGADLPTGEGFEAFTADSRFAYADGGGRAVVRAAHGATIADFTYGSHPAESLNLAVDLDGDEYMPHGSLTDGEAIFSPGKCANGQPFPTGCGRDDKGDDHGDDNGDDDGEDWNDLNDYKSGGD